VIKLKMKPADPLEFKDKQMSLTQKDVVFSSLYSDRRFLRTTCAANQVEYYVDHETIRGCTHLRSKFGV